MQLVEAKKRVEEYLKNYSNPYYNIEFIILDQLTREEDFGWIFFYDSKKYLESGNIADAIAGNAPIFVDKNTGSLSVTGTAHTIEHI